MEDHHKHHVLTQGEIAKVAYELYLAQGRPQGCDIEHWLKAEQELLNKRPQPLKGVQNPAAVIPTKAQPVVETSSTKTAERKVATKIT